MPPKGKIRFISGYKEKLKMFSMGYQTSRDYYEKGKWIKKEKID
jgi:hypothetical protein